MTHLVTFTSSWFDTTVEKPNPINPIAGEGILNWLREQLRGVGYEVTAPEPEDWGWYIYVKDRGNSYLVGASSDLNQPAPKEWTVQIHRERSLTDKLFWPQQACGRRRGVGAHRGIHSREYWSARCSG